MRRSVLLLAAFALPLLSEDAGAQNRPDFSGAWTAVGQPTGSATGSLGSGWGASFTIMQGPNMLTVERVFFSRTDLQPPMRFQYSLDGSESRNTVLVGRGEQVQISTAIWDGDSVVITTAFTVPGTIDGQTITSETTQTLSLLPPTGGRLAWPPSLVIETVRGGALGGPPSTTRTVYIRN